MKNPGYEQSLEACSLLAFTSSVHKKNPKPQGKNVERKKPSNFFFYISMNAALLQQASQEERESKR